MNKSLCLPVCLLAVTLVGLSAATVARAQDSAEATHEGTLAAPPPTLDKGDNAWVLTSSALVLMMTAPGLAMFYGGLVRKKNVVNVFMQCFFLMGLNTVLWGLCCYSLCFGGTGAWLGDTSLFFMKGVESTWTES